MQHTAVGVVGVYWVPASVGSTGREILNMECNKQVNIILHSAAFTVVAAIIYDCIPEHMA
jgi:hypothetical protein